MSLKKDRLPNVQPKPVEAEAGRNRKEPNEHLNCTPKVLCPTFGVPFNLTDCSLRSFFYRLPGFRFVPHISDMLLPYRVCCTGSGMLYPHTGYFFRFGYFIPYRTEKPFPYLNRFQTIPPRPMARRKNELFFRTRGKRNRSARKHGPAITYTYHE